MSQIEKEEEKKDLTYHNILLSTVFQEDMKKLLESATGDVTILISSKLSTKEFLMPETINCHSAILCARSVYFKDMIEKGDDEINIIDLTKYDYELIKEMIEYLYGGKEFSFDKFTVEQWFNYLTIIDIMKIGIYKDSYFIPAMKKKITDKNLYEVLTLFSKIESIYNTCVEKIVKQYNNDKPCYDMMPGKVSGIIYCCKHKKGSPIHSTTNYCINYTLRKEVMLSTTHTDYCCQHRKDSIVNYDKLKVLPKEIFDEIVKKIIKENFT